MLDDLIPTWSPNQIRHTALENTTEKMDANSAAAMAGHAPSRQALDAYVRETVHKAMEVAAKCG